MTQYFGLIKALQNAWRESEKRERELQQMVDQATRGHILTPREREELICQARHLLQEQWYDVAEQAQARFLDSLKRLWWRIFLVLCALVALGALEVVRNWIGELIR